MATIYMETNSLAVRQQLARIRKAAVFASEKQAMDAGARLLKAALGRQWRRDGFTVRRKTFPDSVLKVHKSYINFATGGIVRPARVVNTGADRILRLQIQGGIKHPQGKALVIPVKPTGRKTKTRPANLYRAGDELFVPRKRGKDKYWGTLAKSAKVPRKWRIRLAVARVEKRLPRITEGFLRKELREAIRRRGR